MLTESRKFDYTIIPLVIANLSPLYGVLFEDWSIFQVMFLFWSETAIIGLFSAFKLIKVIGPLAIVAIPFFSFHFGMFMFGHLTFIYTMFGTGTNYSSFIPPLSLILESLNGLELSILLLFISHGISFYVNFIQKGEYLLAKENKQAISPYGRVVVMHLTIIFGGWIILGLHSPVGALVLLVIGKIVLDINSHLRAHKKVQAALNATAPQISPLQFFNLAIQDIAKQKPQSEQSHDN
jgi:hypothetical protein